MDKKKRAVWGWAMYDWANSAFSTAVMAGFFPVFFKKYWSYDADLNLSTAQLGFGNSIASLMVALMAPVLGAIADKGSAKKKFLVFFAYLGAVSTAGLFLVEQGAWESAIVVYALGVIGFFGANVFYDSFLPHVADENRVDYVSGLGFSMGYLGGGLLFLFTVLCALMPQKFGFADSTQAVRYAFLFVALWWGGFTLFTIITVPERTDAAHAHRDKGVVLEGIRQLLSTLRKARHLKTVFLFLLAYWFYIDGVDTIIVMAVDYGMSLGFDSNDLILALLIVQFVGFPAAFGFGKLGGWWGPRKGIYLAIGVYVFLTLWGVMMKEKWEFYVLAVIIGCVQGGIQALSRSYYTRLIPKDQSAEFYGFYNMIGKFAAILGPVLMGTVGLLAKRLLMPVSPTPDQLTAVGQLASRASIASLLVLFIIGGVLLRFVDEERGKKEAMVLSKGS
jgi:UMF1 family MFS transporter